MEDTFNRHNCDLVVIPGDITSRLQLLDVCLNKPFKGKKRNITIGYTSTTIRSLLLEKIRKASAEIGNGWASIAWKKIPSELIIQTILHQEFLNRTDDDLLRNREDLYTSDTDRSNDATDDSESESDSDSNH